MAIMMLSYQIENFGMMDVCKRNFMSETYTIVPILLHHRILYIEWVDYHQNLYSTQGGRNSKLFMKNLINSLCHNFGLFVRKKLYQNNYKLMDGKNKNLFIKFYLEWIGQKIMIVILYVYMVQ